MSPQHAKVFAQLLSLNVKNYEEIFGFINTEPKADAIDKVNKLTETE